MRFLGRGYCNVMLAYWVDYLDNERKRAYFDYQHEANYFIKKYLDIGTKQQKRKQI